MALISTFIVDGKRPVRTFSVLLCLAVFGSSSSSSSSSSGEVRECERVRAGVGSAERVQNRCQQQQPGEWGRGGGAGGAGRALAAGEFMQGVNTEEKEVRDN